MEDNMMMALKGKLRPAFFGLMFIVLLASCLDDDDGYTTPPVPLAYVSIYHASPDAPPLDVEVDDKRVLSQPFGYTNGTSYLNFYTGNRKLEFRPSNASNALIDTTFNFEDGKFYSLFVVERLSDIQALVITDTASSPTNGNAKVRLIHLSPDAPAVNVVDAGNEGDTLFTNTAFKKATPFIEVPAKSYDFKVEATADGAEMVAAEGVKFQPGRFYTIIVRGFADAPEGNANTLSVEVVNN